MIKLIKSGYGKVVSLLMGCLPFYRDLVIFWNLSRRTVKRHQLSALDLWPCLFEKNKEPFVDRHYIYHTAWAARILAKTRPNIHIDISSSLFFVSMVSGFVPIRFYDFRKPDLTLDGLTVESANLLNLPFDDNSISSLSCMHVVEHIGLGRYGDELDPDGDLKAISELTRVLAHGGQLLFVVPVGRSRIQFNAHRIYSYEQVTGYFKRLELREFSLIPDSPKDGGLIRNVAKGMADQQSYGCGCFWFMKP
ncbi:MAG: DUF268 domain-containing protein [Deltaproteobacteria bacterium]|nr:DUF268 domain-containing protein [Deltaproteobacteria bacterium]